MNNAKLLLGRTYRHFMHDSLRRNSIYLMASTAINAITGFIFLVTLARFYQTEDVGRATVTISIVGLLASISILGLNNAVIRFAKSLKQLDSYINTVLVVICGTILLVSTFFVFNSFWLSTKLNFIAHSISLTLLFITLCILVTVNTFTDSVFVAKRIAVFVFIENIFQGIIKVALPGLFSSSGYTGIIISYSLSVIAALAVTAFGFHKFGYKFLEKPNFSLMNGTKAYAFGNYISGIASSGAPLLIPAIALNELGAKNSAFFYVALTIANILLVIPSSINRSLFAEGSNDEASLSKHVIKSSKLIGVLLCVSLIGVIILGKIVLHAFGTDYAAHAYMPLLLLSLSAVFAAVNNTVGTILNVRRKISGMTLMNVIGFAATIICCIIGGQFGLVQLCAGWLLGQFITALTATIFYFKYIYNNAARV